MSARALLLGSLLGLLLSSCSSDSVVSADPQAGQGGAGGAGGSSPGGAGGSAGVDAGQGGTDASNGGSGGGAAGEAGQSGGDAATSAPDPRNAGPFQYAEVDDTMASEGDNVPVHCAHPTSGPSAGPYPVVVVAHGMQLPASQYYGYVRALASFGYVALTVDFPTSLLSVNNPKNAKQLVAGLDWAASQGFGADASTAGMTGHSLGGKLALLASTLDSRVKAAITLDPVDGGGPTGCTPPGCVDVSALLPNLAIPTGFVGETLDAQGGLQPCAPAAANFLTFYANAQAPSLAVTVNGANHMSFLDDVSSCGMTCSFCNAATLANDVVTGLARAYVVSFYERHLRQNTAYDAWLTGAEAQAAWIDPGTISAESK